MHKNPLRKRKTQEDFSLYKKFLEKFENFENFRATLEEVIHCIFLYAKRIFFFILRPFSFKFIVIVFYLFLLAFMLIYWLFSYFSTAKKVLQNVHCFEFL